MLLAIFKCGSVTVHLAARGQAFDFVNKSIEKAQCQQTGMSVLAKGGKNFVAVKSKIVGQSPLQITVCLNAVSTKVRF